ncbi:MAG TPA: PIN domain-containing protein [Polyangia bacterium]|nr:PIN domain-containing protein [Polyangia bacterium]
MAGLTFDTGALINLERRRLDMRKLVEVALEDQVPVTVPAVVVAEWWRTGRHTRERETILRMFVVEPLTEYVAKLAGEALTRVPRAGTIDAIVMASASLRGDIVYTSDLGDLARLQERVFRSVRIEQA